MLIEYTLWPGGMFDIDSPTPVQESWDAFVARFAAHRRVARKQDSPGFGPYRIRPPRVPCYRHRDGVPRDQPHRCDDCVDVLTLAVFDADAGAQADVDACDARLGAAGLARLWYSSYSHGRDGKCAYRLVLPLSEPVAPSVWPGFRVAVMREFAVPADPQQCQGRSHYYHQPSCPKRAEPVVRHAAGAPLAVRRFAAQPIPPNARHYVRVVDDFDPPDEPVVPADLEPLRRRLTVHHAKLVKDPGASVKATWLGRMLAGVELDAHGQRNRALLCVTGMLAYVTPGHSLGTYQRMVESSLAAMIAAGSSHTADDVERMLLSAMRNKYMADKIDNEGLVRMRNSVSRIVAQAQAEARSSQ